MSLVKEKLMEVYDSIKKLQNYWFDNQYINEIMQDMEKLIKEIKVLENRLKDNEHKGYDNTALEMKILHLKSKQKSLLSFLKKMIAKNQQVEFSIEQMTQPYKNILFLKYIKNYSFDEIASKMNYSSKRIYQLHKIAINLYIENNDDLMIIKN